ncbi:MAG TPA: hypothetical protein VNG93_03380 [Candidatus Dormibacteraeota bacterium]|nr:hypothetical protein [Candidatus Dormibacteraeota bacterium]
MRRVLAAVLPLLTVGALACGSPAPALHPDVLLIASPDGSRVVVRNVGGAILGHLPAGILALSLTGGDDIAEAYLVTASASGTVASSVVPSQRYALTPIASEAAAPAAALLLPAPLLTAFVGRKTVLVVYTADGTLTGYQHGSPIWSEALGSGPARLVAVGDRLLLGRQGDWQEVAVETGAIGQSLLSSQCPPPGPIAQVSGRLVFDCGGTLAPQGAGVPAETPFVFTSGPATFLAFPDGEVWRLLATSIRKAFQVPSWVNPPVASLDGSELYLPTPAGVEQVNVATGRQNPLTSPAGHDPSVALSRDGNFLYALAGGVLRTFRLDTGRQVASVVVGGSTIDRVVGG